MKKFFKYTVAPESVVHSVTTAVASIREEVSEVEVATYLIEKEANPSKAASILKLMKDGFISKIESAPLGIAFTYEDAL